MYREWNPNPMARRVGVISGIAEVIKATPLDNKWLPAICIVLGAGLGVAALFIAPEITPATDVLTALAIGIVSGGFATSVHQTIKQLSE